MSSNVRPVFVAFISPKGGVGKSTSCINLATSLTHKGYSVRIVDFDQTETLWRWFSTNENARAISGLSVEKGKTNDLSNYVGWLFSQTGHDFIFIDLAGHLSTESLLIAAAACLTITPCKLNEPDVVEAQKLSDSLGELARRIGKPLKHRILVNEVPIGILPRHQAHTLDNIDASTMVRFANIIKSRPIYSETWLTGQTPHYADQSRPPVQRAVEEIDSVSEELLQLFQSQEESIAA